MAQISADTVAAVAAQLTTAHVNALAARQETIGGRDAIIIDEVYEIYQAFVDRLVAQGGQKPGEFRPSFR